MKHLSKPLFEIRLYIVCIHLKPFMTYFVLNYDSLGYFGGQKWGFGTLVGYHCVIFVCMKH